MTKQSTIFVNGKPLEVKAGESLFEALVNDRNWTKLEANEEPKPIDEIIDEIAKARKQK